MSSSQANDLNNATWIIFRLDRQFYAVSSQEVREMVPLSAVTSVPRVPIYIRGVINLRGAVMPVVDLRRRLGMRSQQKEVEDLLELMKARQEDHIHWLNELESCAKENRVFGLATDPHKCAFGKWYASMKTDNIVLAGAFRAFESPHSAIHEAGKHVMEMVEQGKSQEAMEIVSNLKSTHYQDMMSCFDNLGKTLQDTYREIAMVLEVDKHIFAAVVDGVESVESLNDSMDELPEILQSQGDFIKHVAKRAKDTAFVLVLDPARVINEDAKSPLQASDQIQDGMPCPSV